MSYKLKIKSGERAGRYIGKRLAGFAANREIQKNPPINEAEFGLWAQEQGGTTYLTREAAKKAQAKLTAFGGYETEIVEIR